MKHPLATLIFAAAALATAPALADPPLQDPAPEYLGPIYWNTYFPAGQDVLTPEQHQVAAAAALYAVNSRAKKITIVGHTDASETDDMRLSERRARAAADALVAGGVDRRIIDIEWQGKANLALPTPGRTPEQLNRRALIKIEFDRGRA